MVTAADDQQEYGFLFRCECGAPLEIESITPEGKDKFVVVTKTCEQCRCNGMERGCFGYPTPEPEHGS